VFAGEDLGMTIFNNSQNHQALLNIYEELQNTKQKCFN